MATLELPIEADARHYFYTLELDGRTYGLEFLWNERDEGWSLAVQDDAGAELARARIVVGFPLFRRCLDERLPPGEFIALDTSGADLEPGVDDLGGRVKLLYMEAATLPAEYGPRRP